MIKYFMTLRLNFRSITYNHYIPTYQHIEKHILALPENDRFGINLYSLLIGPLTNLLIYVSHNKCGFLV